MRSGDFIKMGIKNLWRRKLRTILTILGVVIGTFSIVVMVSLGIAMSEGYKKQLMEMGSLTTITVSSYYYNEDMMSSDGGYQPPKQKELNDNLVKELEQIPHVVGVTPVQDMSVRLISGKYEGWASVRGIKPEAFNYFDFPEVEEGRLLTAEDTDQVMLSAYAAYFYNPNSSGGRDDSGYDVVDIMNDRIQMTIDGYSEDENFMPTYYRFKPVGKFAESSGDKNGYIYMNIDQVKKMQKEAKKSGLKTYGNEGYNQIWVNVEDIKYVEEVQDRINAMEYGTNSLADMLKPMQETSNTIQLILGGIGAVSLLVSAIGIANTMVMSIYERTKEIGVMKVLGCLISDIKKLFLFEASMIGLIGGGLGVGLSYLASYFMNKYAGQIGGILGGIGGTGNDISVIPLWLVLLALGFAMLIGILSGYFPARRATKIKALEAMRD